MLRQRIIAWLSQLKAAFKARIRGPRFGVRKFQNLQKGHSGEWLAYRFLRSNGYKIVARNYRRRSGEIDLIGWDKGILTFIEVKFRAQREHGRPEEAVNRRKQKQICRVARTYRKTHNLHDINYRYDIVSIQSTGEEPQLRIIKGAFTEQLY